MAKRGRKRKIEADPTLQARLIEYISQGLTDEMAYSQAGIGHDTFYRYLNEIPEFSEAITHARQQAHIMAVIAVRSALRQSETEDVTTETITETKLRKVKTDKGIEEVPYEYTKTIVRKTRIQHPADWRAGVEWLKRRDRDNWTDKQIIQVDDWEREVIELLKAGKVTPEQVEAELGISLAERLFNTAGISITPTGKG